MSPLIALLVIALAILPQYGHAKGSFGYARSSGGGYVRASKTGYYSRTNRYYFYGMYWRGNGYHYSGFRGSATRPRATSLTPEEMQDVMCQRTVELVDYPTDGAVRFNSTRNCFKELFAQPGHPGNLPFDAVMLDRYQFTISSQPYPQVDLLVYPDKDIDVPSFNTSLRFTELIFPTSLTSESSVDAPLSLENLSWETCTLGNPSRCQTNKEPSISSRHLDGARQSVVTFKTAFTSGDKSGTLSLRFWLTNDFAEDPYVENVFLLPSMVKVDVDVQFTSVGVNNRYTGIKALLVTPSSGEGSDLTPVPARDISTAYDPKAMNRIEIGTTVDQQNGKAGILSWWASAAVSEPLCRPVDGVEFTCNQFLTGFVKNTLKTQKLVCSKDATGAFSNVKPSAHCDASLLKNSQSAYEVAWALDSKGFTSQNGLDHSWYLDFGYWDPAQGVQADIPTSGEARVSPHVFVIALGTVLLFLLS